MNAFFALAARDVRLALRPGGDWITAVSFFFLAVLLFPFGIGPDMPLLGRIAPGVVLAIALLASLLSLEHLFQNDYEDGSLDQLILSPLSPELCVLAKVGAHWLVTGFPLLLAAPVLAFLLGMEGKGYIALLAAMALATPSLSLLGALGAALSLGSRRGGILLVLLVLPLYIPLLVFAAGGVASALQGENFHTELMLLGAFLLLALPLCPWAAAAALRQAVE